MKRQIERRLNAGLGIALLLIFVSGWFSDRITTHLFDSANRVSVPLRIFCTIAVGSAFGVIALAVAGHFIRRHFNRRRIADGRHRELMEGFQLLVNGAKEYAIFMLNNDGIVQSWNEGSQRIKGYSPDEIIGKSFTCFYTEEDLKDGKPQRELKIAVETGRYEEDGWRVRKDGSRFWANVIIRPMYDPSGGQIGFSKITRDLTSQIKFEQQVIEAREKAEAANRAKSNFLANMSHEIRTPMTAILGFSDMILQPDQSDEGRIECVQVIRRNGTYLLELINHILDLSKIEEHQMTIENIRCELAPLLADIVATVRPRAAEKGIEFKVNFSCPIPRFIQTDPTRLRQILINLLGNAIKFTASGKITLAVCAEGPGAGSTIRAEVTDTGIGMTSEQLNRLFLPFSQADDSITRKFGGTGLGLTISRQLANLLGGDIEVKSAIGIGSTFTMRINVGSFEGVEMLTDLHEKTLPSVAPTDKWQNIPLQGRILLAEDGRDNQRLLSMHLRACGAEVVIAENGQIAVDLATKEFFDLILMDMQMPVMDGYTAATTLRRQGCEVPIIALTAYAMAEDRKRCMDSGCSDYLSKPIDRDIFLKTVGQYLKRTSTMPVPNLPPVVSVVGKTLPGIQSTLRNYPGMKPIIIEFVDGLPAEVRKLTDFLEQNEMGSLRRVVHQLRGAGGGYGFEDMTEPAEKAEKSIDASDDLRSVTSAIDSLIDVIRHIEGYNEANASVASGHHVSAA